MTEIYELEVVDRNDPDHASRWGNWRELTGRLNNREQRLHRVETLLDELDSAIARASDQLTAAERLVRHQSTSSRTTSSTVSLVKTITCLSYLYFTSSNV